LQQAVAFFNLGGEEKPARKSKPDGNASPDRRAMSSPMRSPAKTGSASLRVAATGTHGNFRPY